MGGNMFKNVFIKNWKMLIDEMFVIKFIKLKGVIGNIWMVVMLMILLCFSFLLMVVIFGLLIFLSFVLFDSLFILNMIVEFISVFMML